MHSGRYSLLKYHMEYFNSPPITCLPSLFYLFQSVINGVMQCVTLQTGFFHFTIYKYDSSMFFAWVDGSFLYISECYSTACVWEENKFFLYLSLFFIEVMKMKGR